MRRLIVSLVVFGAFGCSNVDVIPTPGLKLPVALAPAPRVVHDPPADVASLVVLGTIHVQEANVKSQADCEEEAVTAAQKKLGGAVFFERHVSGVWGSGPACECTAYGTK